MFFFKTNISTVFSNKLYLFIVFSLIVCSIISCKSPMDVDGDHNDKIDPEKPFDVAVFADEGEGTHYLNGSTKRWEIDGQKFLSAPITVDTSRGVHRITINGQFSSKPEIIKVQKGKDVVDSIIQPNKKDLSAYLQAIGFRLDSLALSDIPQVVSPQSLNVSDISFLIKRTFFRPYNGKKVQDTISERFSLKREEKREDIVKGLVTVQFKHLPNDGKLKYRYQSVLEINFKLAVSLEQSPQIFTEYPIRGIVRFYFNYGEIN